MKSYKVYNGEVFSMCAVSLKIRYQNTGKELDTYTLLDSFSPVTFIRKDIVRTLEVSRYKTQISMKTLNRNQTNSSHGVENLEKAIDGICKKQLIKLPKSYTIKELPVNGQEVFTKEKIAKWQYLQKISKIVCQENYVNVIILLGAIYSKKEPAEVFPNQIEETYILRTLLGWWLLLQLSILVKRVAIQIIMSTK